MLIPKQPRLRDRAYLDTARGRGCAVAGCWRTDVIAAHIREGNRGGMGLKPNDSEIEWLCDMHHRQQHEFPGAKWWMDTIGGGPENISPEEWLELYYVPMRISAYNSWVSSGRRKLLWR